MEFELINPSDPYTFLAESEEVAALVVFSISTAYGAKSKDKSIEIPVFIFGGAAEWYEERFGRDPDAGMEALRQQVGKSLCSMMYGHFSDRERYELALESIDDEEKRKKFVIRWNDARSSINDIGTYCHILGEKLQQEEKDGNG